MRESPRLRAPAPRPLVVLSTYEIDHGVPTAEAPEEPQYLGVYAHAFEPGTREPARTLRIRVAPVAEILHDWEDHLENLERAACSPDNRPAVSLAALADFIANEHAELVEAAPEVNEYTPVPDFYLSDDARRLQEIRTGARDGVDAPEWAAEDSGEDEECIDEDEYIIVTRHPDVTTDIAWHEARRALAVVAPELAGYDVCPNYAVPDGLADVQARYGAATGRLSAATSLAELRTAAVEADALFYAEYAPLIHAMNVSRFLEEEVDPNRGYWHVSENYDAVLRGEAPLPSQWRMLNPVDTPQEYEEFYAPIREIDTVQRVLRCPMERAAAISHVTDLLPYAAIFPTLPIATTLAALQADPEY